MTLVSVTDLVAYNHKLLIEQQMEAFECAVVRESNAVVWKTLEHAMQHRYRALQTYDNK